MTWIVLALLGSGVALAALSAVGILRMPDVYTRMQASSKAGTLGCILIVGAVAIAYGDASVAARALVVIAFVLMTAPVAAHVVSRAAYRTGTRPAEVEVDELADWRRRHGAD